MALLWVGGSVEAQAPEPVPDEGSLWSVGTSLTYPVARIYQVHVNRRTGENGEFVFGPAYQNFRSGSITSHAYTLILGYRWYLWRGLQVESEWWPAYNRMHSSVTDERYPGWELWTEIKAGYTIPLGERFFLQRAPGVGSGIFRTNRPPQSTMISSHPPSPPRTSWECGSDGGGS